MNYKECRIANELLDRINEINIVIRQIEKNNYTPIYCFRYKIVLSDEPRETVLEVIKKFRDEMVGKLKELGVTEESKDETTENIR